MIRTAPAMWLPRPSPMPSTWPVAPYGVLVRHWRVVRIRAWLSEKSGTRWSDLRLPVKPLHAHSIDAAQQGFYKPIVPHGRCQGWHAGREISALAQAFRTTVWKNRGSKNRMRSSRCPTGKATSGSPLHCLRRWPVLRVLEVRLVYDRKARRHTWHVVVENGSNPRQPRAPTW